MYLRDEILKKDDGIQPSGATSCPAPWRTPGVTTTRKGLRRRRGTVCRPVLLGNVRRNRRDTSRGELAAGYLLYTKIYTNRMSKTMVGLGFRCIF